MAEKLKFYYQHYQLPLPAQTVGDELMRIRNQAGKLTPETVLEQSRDEKAVLHPLFTWNDKEAAEKHRLNEARRILMLVHVKENDLDPDLDPNKTRAFVVVHAHRPESEFVPVQVALVSPEAAQELLKRAYQEYQAFKNKYESIKGLQFAFQGMEQAFRDLTKKKNVS